MTTPIKNKIGSVFVHVSDLRHSAEWYSKLMGLPLLEERLNGGPVYWFELEGETGLILDNNQINREQTNWDKTIAPQYICF
jgi:catechol 2,3-dioxygenase-like lactoylglutathione lyase family enzyme